MDLSIIHNYSFFPLLLFKIPTRCLFCYRLIHGGQFLNGLAGPTIMSAGPYLSTTWFAPDQRATATAVASLFSYLGGAASFIVGPLAVPAPNDSQPGTTTAAPLPTSFIQKRIQLVMYAGKNGMQETWAGAWGSIAHYFDIVSAQSGFRNKIKQQGFKNPTQTPRAPAIILITVPL